ncbi:MFS transporter [Nguyenibacter sp. L1]|uniref:MFS transporter n=1 Tax=Nguyenibacter sp. L1 TaxID=3049350 RepID=UPI0038D171FD
MGHIIRPLDAQARASSGSSHGGGSNKEASRHLDLIYSVMPTFVCFLAIGFPLAVLPRYIHEQMGYSVAVTGVAMSLQYLATCLVRPMAGRLVDRSGPKPAVMCGLAACCLSGVLLAGAIAMHHDVDAAIGALVLLLLGRVVLGFAESWTATGVIMWGIQKSGIERAPTVISWNGVASYGGIAVGAPFGAALGQGLSVANQLEILAALSALLSAIALWVTSLREPVIPQAANRRLPFGHVMSKIKFFGLALALGSLGFSAVSTFAALYYASRQWQGVSLALSTFAICFILIRFVFSNSIERFGGIRVSVVALLSETVGLGLLAIAPSSVLALVAIGLTGAGFSLVPPALGTEVVRRAGVENRGTALGAFTLFFDIALGVGGPVMGWIATRGGYGTVFATAAVAALTGAITVSVILGRRS